MNTFINNKNYVGKMRNNKIFLLTILLMTILLFSIIITASGINDQGTVKKGNTINLTQSCNDATYITLSSIQYPDRHTEYIGENMTSLGSGTYQYSFNDTEEIGRYDINGISDGCTETFAFYFEVTKSGRLFGESSGGFGIAVIIGVVAASFGFLVFGIKMQDNPKTLPLALVFFIMSIILFLFGLNIGWVYADNVMQYDAIGGVSSAIFTSFLWILVGIVIISMSLMLIAFIKNLSAIVSQKKFGDDFDPITETYEY